MADIALVFAGSFVAGYLGSALGLVLGTLRLPLLVLLSPSAAAAAGTNIAISTASAVSASVVHARAGRIDWRVVAWMTPPSVVGAVIGAVLADSVPERALYAAIAAILAWQAVDLVFRPFREQPAQRPRLAPAVGFGFAIAVVGGAAGVILGTLRMPALLRAVRLTAHRAVGTNLVVGALLGAAAFGTHAAKLHVEWDLLAAGLAGSLPGGWLGAGATGRLSEQALRRAIGVILLVVALAFAVQAAVGA